MKLAVCLVLFAITWAVFGQTIGHQFVNYDDPLYVLENAHIRAGLSWNSILWAFTHVHSQNWHPLTSISHMLDCQLFGLQPGWHHFVNVLLHSAVVVLLFLVLEQMTGGPSRTGTLWRSAFVAALFAIHPLRAESVAWIAERKDMLSGVFFMLTLAFYLRYVRRPSIGRYVIMSVFFACGLMSKPILVPVPIVLLLLDYWPLARGQRSEVSGQRSEIQRGGSRLLAEKIPLFVLAIGSIVATLLAQNFALGSTEQLPLQWRITNAVVTYVDYIGQMFWPIDLIPFYVHPENRLGLLRLIVAIAILAALATIALVRYRKNPYILVGLLWYVLLLVPVIGLVQVGLQGRADRYTYLPQIGICIAVVWLISDLTKSWRQQKVILGATGTIAVGALSILCWKQTTHWRDTETLWRYTLSVTPDSDVAHAGLAGILFARGQLDESILHCRRALSLRDGNVAAQYGLAMALAQQRKFDEAILHFQKALAIQPDNTLVSNNLGSLLANRGEIADAIAAWRQTLHFDSDNAEAANNLAWARATCVDPELRDGKEAVELAQKAVRLSGKENPAVLRTLAAALAENNQFSEAVAVAERGKALAEASGNTEMAETLQRCLELFRQGQPLHNLQVAH
jgi:Tfp pilus assembly protein PilF